MGSSKTNLTREELEKPDLARVPGGSNSGNFSGPKPTPILIFIIEG